MLCQGTNQVLKQFNEITRLRQATVTIWIWARRTPETFWNMASTLFNKCGVIEGYRASRSSHAQTSVSSLALAHVPSQSGGKRHWAGGLACLFLSFCLYSANMLIVVRTSLWMHIYAHTNSACTTHVDVLISTHAQLNPHEWIKSWHSFDASAINIYFVLQGVSSPLVEFLWSWKWNSKGWVIGRHSSVFLEELWQHLAHQQIWPTDDADWIGVNTNIPAPFKMLQV
jgi:hypothetical protein